MTKQEAMLPCFVCGIKVERAFDYELQPSDATTFTTYGHYGSTFWDSFVGEEIAIIICDECLKNRTNRIARHKRFRQVVVLDDTGRFKSRYIVGREWLDREPVPYFEGDEDDNDEVPIQAEDIGVLTGYNIEWVKDWPTLKEHILEALAVTDAQDD